MSGHTSIFARYECKYVIDEILADRVRAALVPWVQPDPFAAQRPGHTYGIRSLYLDSPNLRLFRETLEGDCDRVKLRVREYLDAEAGYPVFLEIKRRHDRMVLKARAALPRATVADLLAGVPAELPAMPPAEAACEAEFARYLDRWQASPVTWIAYAREAYVGQYHDGVRVTFDRDLRCAAAEANIAPDDLPWRRFAPGQVVLEFKFDHAYPAWMRRVVAQCELEQRSFSKYGTSVRRALEPWHRPAAVNHGTERW